MLTPGNPKPNCWPVALVVRNGITEGSWLSHTKNTSKANGRFAANGAFELKLSAWTREGKPIGGVLVGRVANNAITGSGQWSDGGVVSGSWKRQMAAAAPTTTNTPKSAAQHDGAYSGQLCNYSKGNPQPRCRPVALAVRNGIVDGSWIGGMNKTSRASGTVAADGALELKLAGWTREGNAADAVMVGRAANGEITATGQWRGSDSVTGNWKRTR